MDLFHLLEKKRHENTGRSAIKILSNTPARVVPYLSLHF